MEMEDEKSLVGSKEIQSPVENVPEICILIDKIRDQLVDQRLVTDWVMNLTDKLGGPIPREENYDNLEASPDCLLDHLEFISRHMANENRKIKEAFKRINSLI